MVVTINITVSRAVKSYGLVRTCRRFGVAMKGRYTATSLLSVVDQHTLTLILSTYIFLPHTCIKKFFPHVGGGPGSVVGTATGSNPGGGGFSASVQTGPGARPASCTMGTGSFPGVKSGRGVTLIPHPLLAP